MAAETESSPKPRDGCAITRVKRKTFRFCFLRHYHFLLAHSYYCASEQKEHYASFSSCLSRDGSFENP